MSNLVIHALPDDWNENALEELIVSGSRITYGVVQPGEQDPKGVPFIRGGDINNGKIAINKLRTISKNISASYGRTLLKGGELLMSLVGYPGEVAIVPKSLAGANIARQAAYIKLGKAVDSKYVMYYLLSDLGKYYLFQKSTGSAQQVINLVDLKDVRVVFPPLPEQQKIAAILTSVDEVIEKTQAQIDKLKDLKTAMMQTLLTNGVGNKPASADAALNNRTACRESNIPHTEFKDSPVGRIPKSWEVSKLGELFHVQLGKMLSKASKVGDSPCSYLGNKNVQWGKVDLSNLERMDFKDAERKKFSLIKGDLLICEGGDVGRTAIWQGEMTNCYYQKAIHRLRPISSRFEPFLLMEYMRFSKETGLLVDFISQTSIAHLTKEKLISIPLPVPPMEEQKMMVSILKSIAEKIEIRSKKLQKNKELKKALMQDLLTGKVRVKVD